MDGLPSLDTLDSPAQTPIGLIKGLDAEAYHASPGVSQSRLKLFAGPGGPAKYRAGARIETPALKFGGILHTAVLEPHLLERRYCVTEQRAGTKAWDEAERRAGGRMLIRRSEYDQAQRMRDAVQAHAGARELLTPELEIETSMFWSDPETRLLCRGRPDGLRRDWRLMVDVKSCADATPEGFAGSCAAWGYDWQQYFYETGYALAGRECIENFVFIAVEKEPPHLTALYDLDRADIIEAGADLQATMRDLKRAYDTDNWPGYGDELRTVSLPKAPRRKFM